MATSKIAWDGEWVSIANMRNKRFKADDPRCEICLKLTCAPVWFSIKTKKVKCKQCFTPEQLKEQEPPTIQETIDYWNPPN